MLERRLETPRLGLPPSAWTRIGDGRASLFGLALLSSCLVV